MHHLIEHSLNHTQKACLLEVKVHQSTANQQLTYQATKHCIVKLNTSNLCYYLKLADL